MSGYRITGGGVSDALPAFVDAVSLNVTTTDANDTPTDDGTFAIALAASDTNDAQAEAIQLGLTESEANTAPGDSQVFTMLVWLSGAAGGANVTNPANANSQNNGSSSSQQTILLGALTSQLTANLGSNVPSGISVLTVSLRVWFTAATTLITSNINLTLKSLTALFADEIVFTQSAAGTTTDHSAGTFTFDIIAAGINSLAKIQSIQFVGNTSDLAAGVTPAVLTIDAAALVITGAFA